MEGIFRNQKRTETKIEDQRSIGEAGMVASAAREATEAGLEVLRQGGNAMDALVAVQFALGVVEMFNTGIGANGFIIYHDRQKQKTKVVQGHSKAPKGAREDIFLQKDGSVISYFERSIHPKAVAIPGIMKAMDTALNEFGTMPLDQLIEPAVKLAEDGFRVNWLWGQAIETLQLRMGEEAKAFFIPNGIPRVEGEWVKNESLARTLRIIQKEGVKAIYEGQIADAIVETLQKLGGIMTKEDLREYKVKIEDPVTGSYKGFDLAVPPPPNGAAFLLQMMKLLEGFEIEKYKIDSWEKYYLLAEAMRLAFSDKLAYMTDPAFDEIPVKGLLDQEYIKDRQKMINWLSRNPDIDCGNPWKYQGSDREKGEVKVFQTGEETTHFTVVDKWGNVAACTSSIEHVMGSGIMVPGYGFLLNNDLTDFYPEPGHINSIAANKHPVSTKTPTIIFKDGKPFMTLGSPGGPTIVASVAQTIINIIDYKMDLKEAIEEPRIYNSTGPFIWWEEGMNEKAKQKLEEMGFEFLEKEKPIGNVQAILIDQDKGELFGAADSSRPGAAIGL